MKAPSPKLFERRTREILVVRAACDGVSEPCDFDCTDSYCKHLDDRDLRETVSTTLCKLDSDALQEITECPLAQGLAADDAAYFHEYLQYGINYHHQLAQESRKRAQHLAATVTQIELYKTACSCGAEHPQVALAESHQQLYEDRGEAVLTMEYFEKVAANREAEVETVVDTTVKRSVEKARKNNVGGSVSVTERVVTRTAEKNIEEIAEKVTEEPKEIVKRVVDKSNTEVIEEDIEEIVEEIIEEVTEESIEETTEETVEGSQTVVKKTVETKIREVVEEPEVVVEEIVEEIVEEGSDENVEETTKETVKGSQTVVKKTVEKKTREVVEEPEVVIEEIVEEIIEEETEESIEETTEETVEGSQTVVKKTVETKIREVVEEPEVVVEEIVEEIVEEGSDENVEETTEEIVEELKKVVEGNTEGNIKEIIEEIIEEDAEGSNEDVVEESEEFAEVGTPQEETMEEEGDECTEETKYQKSKNNQLAINKEENSESGPDDTKALAKPSEKSMQRTLILVKPEAFAAGRKAQVLKALSDAGFVVIKEKEFTSSKGRMQDFYIDLKSKVYYNDLVTWMSSDKMYAAVIEGVDAVAKTKEIFSKLHRRKQIHTVRDGYYTLHCTPKAEAVEKEIHEIFGRRVVMKVVKKKKTDGSKSAKKADTPEKTKSKVLKPAISTVKTMAKTPPSPARRISTLRDSQSSPQSPGTGKVLVRSSTGDLKRTVKK